MTLETATYINGLNASYPEGSADRSTADDHLRLIKSTVLATFPNITGAVSVGQAQLNLLAGLTDTLTTVLARYSLSISAAAADIARISQTVSVAVAKIAAFSLSISAINTRVDTLSQSVSLAQADIARISQTVSVAIARLAAASTSIATLEARAVSVSADVVRFSLSISALNTDLHSVSALIQASLSSVSAALQTAINSVSNTVSVIGARVVSISALNTQYSLSISAINTQVFNTWQTAWVPAGAMVPTDTNGAAPGTEELATNDVMLKVLDFDAATAEYAQFTVKMPKGWNEGSVKARVAWKVTSLSGQVIWGISTLARGGGDALDAAFGTAVSITSTTSVIGSLVHTLTLSAITVASPTEEDLVWFRIQRTAAGAGDTLTGDARLLGVSVLYQATGLTDA